MKLYRYTAVSLLAGSLFVLPGLGFTQTWNISDSGDFGNSHRNYPSSRAVDGDTNFSSRWAARIDNDDANLFVDFGTSRTVDNIGIAWGRGNNRTYRFEIRARNRTSGSWARIFSGTSSRNTSIQNYNVNDISARQVRVKVFEDSASDGSRWVNITEFEVYGTSGRSGGNDGSSSPSPTPTPTPTPTPNNPTFGRVTVPATLQAENFTDYRDADSANRGGEYRDTGVDIQRCSDGNNCFNIGWTNPGERLEYDMNVSSSGTYEARLRIASRRNDFAYSIDVDGRDVTGTRTLSGTGGWQTWRTRTVSLGNLSAGNRTLRLNVENSNFNINWIDIVRTGGTFNDNPSPTNDNFGLNPNRDPWDNFDLRRWAIDTPAERSDDRCRAERTWEYEWTDSDPLGSRSRPFFFTHSDGGMRFVTRIDGATTNSSCNSGFVRSELREMLRAGDRNIDDTSVSRNNWKLGYQPGRASDWGGENGRIDATLRVNEVTTSGSSSQVGRVIIGQIHADNDEPLRLYYRKRSGESRGCIYFSHEIRNGDDVDFNMIGNEACTSPPSSGIELNELFSYSIINDDEDLTVIIRRGDRDGPVIAQRTIDMNSLDSGYDRSDEWMYFKAGAYTQNDSGNGSDGDIVTFYRLNVSHD